MILSIVPHTEGRSRKGTRMRCVYDVIRSSSPGMKLSMQPTAMRSILYDVLHRSTPSAIAYNWQATNCDAYTLCYVDLLLACN